MAITSDIQLSVYNGALRRLGSRRLASLTENRKPRRVLDDIWNNGEAVRKALTRADWNFALRAIKMEPDTDIETGFGFDYAYTKPEDFIRLSALGGDEYFRHSLIDGQYTDEAGFWLTGIDPLYVRFVSSDGSFGFDSSKWTPGFRDYLECEMAFEACEPITNSRSKLSDISVQKRDALAEAKSNDAMNEGVKMLPSGSWSRARGGRHRGRIERPSTDIA